MRRLAVGLVLLLALVAGLFQLSRAPCFQLVGDLVCRVETDQRVVALSFDDGPTAQGVDAVLAELEPRGLKATFFLIGNDMEQHPQQARRLTEAGMELGNHTYSHRTMLLHTPGFYAEEVTRADALLDVAGRTGPKLFRPPYGKRLLGLPQAVDAAGYTTVTWDVADNVGAHPTPRAYADDILSRVRPGSIVLMHPMYRGNGVEREALALVLDGLAARGLRVVTVGELLALRGASD
ncbi:polysaccharide deacetylase [Aurantiacibacter luteus]|uniref:Chitooligosaccharide deacetylase n=1 Tax=Aurantiacibacter luteus TaxID=1581420 RepID=A0A0G9MVR7_9SPHN|nr:polysaccharide deacetylase [Aurantiacibacter luteus]